MFSSQQVKKQYLKENVEICNAKILSSFNATINIYVYVYEQGGPFCPTKSS